MVVAYDVVAYTVTASIIMADPNTVSTMKRSTVACITAPQTCM